VDDLTLSSTLLRYLPDSSVEVVSSNAAGDELVLRVTQEIGGDIGVFRFAKVSHADPAPSSPSPVSLAAGWNCYWPDI
jgi:hypothetical protein